MQAKNTKYELISFSYNQNGKEHPMHLDEFDIVDGNIKAKGKDTVNTFTLQGTLTNFDKVYPGHTVNYRGQMVGPNKVEGTWRINTHTTGTFKLHFSKVAKNSYEGMLLSDDGDIQVCIESDARDEEFKVSSGKINGDKGLTGSGKMTPNGWCAEIKGPEGKTYKLNGLEMSAPDNQTVVKGAWLDSAGSSGFFYLVKDAAPQAQ